MELPNKEFWNRPEGTTAKILLAVFGLASAAAIYIKVLPFLLTMVWGTIQLAIGAGIIAAIWFMLNSKRVHSLFFLAISAVSRYITSIFVNIDPVGILKDFVKDMKRKRGEVQTAIVAMRGVRHKSEQARREKEREMEEALKLAQVAQEHGNEEKVNELAERAMRRQRAIESLVANIAFATETLDALQKVDRVIEYHINNSEDEIKTLETDNELALQTLAATKAAGAVLGDSDLKDIKNMAVDVIRDRVARATGEVENLLATTRSVQGEIDLKQLALRSEGRAKLAQLQAATAKAEVGKGSTPKALGAGAAQPISTTNKWANRINVNRPE